MDSPTGLPGKQTLGDSKLTANSKKHVSHTLRIAGFTLWALGFVLLLVSAVIVHSHPGP
jgi:hypothetical protein